MANGNITKEDLTKLEENLGRMIAKGFNENTEQHRQISKVLDKHAAILIGDTERLKRIETKLEGIVYRREFDELKTRVEEIENLLALKKT